jgi:hypothetical protein
MAELNSVLHSRWRDVAGKHFYPTTPAFSSSAASCLDFEPGVRGRIQDGCADGNVDTEPGAIGSGFAEGNRYILGHFGGLT